MRAGFRSLPTWKKPAIKRRRRRILLLVALVALAAVIAPLVAKPAARSLGGVPFFRVGAVEISGLLYLSPDEIRARIPVREGDNLLLVDTGSIEAALRENTRVERAHVARHMGAVHVRIEERRTFVLVSAGSLLEIDEEGTVLTPLRRGLVPDRPIVTGLRVAGAKPGTRLADPRLQGVLRLVRLLESPEVGLVSEISEIAADVPGRIVLRTSRDQIPIFVDPERVSLAAMRAVAATLRDVRERHRRVLVLDARYRGQVVVRCAPESTAVAVTRGKV
jgi:cell division septal protein FtsQ